MKVPAERLRQALGICDVTVVPGKRGLAIVDQPLDRSEAKGNG
jgi:hypothetical protein